MRLTRLNPDVYNDSIHDITMVNYFTQAAMHFSLIAECFTCLKPFLQTFHEGFAISDGGDDYWGGLSGNMSGQRSNPMSNGSNAEKSSKRPKLSQREISHDSVKLRTDRSGFSTRIESERRNHHKSRGEDDIELLPNSNIWVQQTTTLSTSR